MMFFAFIFALCEFIIWRESKWKFDYVSKFKLFITLLVFIYCLSTLREMNKKYKKGEISFCLDQYGN